MESRRAASPVWFLSAVLVAVPALAIPLPDPMPEGPGHRHADASQHRLQAGDISFVGHYNPSRLGFATTGPPAADHDADGGYFGEVDVRGDRAYLAQLKAPAAIHILDISDPSSPTELGRWSPGAGATQITDVKVSLDGRYLYAAYQGGGSNNGIFVLNVEVPSAPVQESHFAVTPGVHMLFVAEVAGQEWVIAPTANGGGGAPIALVIDHPVTGLRTLVQAAVWGVGQNPHDVYVYQDDLLGMPVMAVANGDGGVALVAFAVPAAPVTLGTWNYEGASFSYAHTVRATVIGDTRYLLLSPEGGALGIGTNEVAKLWVLDATNPAAMQTVSSWGNPGGRVAGSFMFSTHNFQLVNRTVYLAHNHGGVWVLDFSNAPVLEQMAYYLPAVHNTTATPGSGGIQDAIPATWDVVVREGLMFAADRSGGLYVLHYGPDEIGPGGPTSYG